MVPSGTLRIIVLERSKNGFVSRNSGKNDFLNTPFFKLSSEILHQGDPKGGAGGHEAFPNIWLHFSLMLGIRLGPHLAAVGSLIDVFFKQSNPPNSQIR